MSKEEAFTVEFTDAGPGALLGTRQTKGMSMSNDRRGILYILISWSWYMPTGIEID